MVRTDITWAKVPRDVADYISSSLSWPATENNQWPDQWLEPTLLLLLLKKRRPLEKKEIAD